MGIIVLVVSKIRKNIAILVCIIGLVFALPSRLPDSVLNNFPSFLRKKINLGLELKGGSHLQFEVDTRDVQRERASAIVSDVRQELIKNEAKYSNITTISSGDSYSCRVICETYEDANVAQGIIRRMYPVKDVNIEINNNVLVVYATKNSLDMLIRRIVNESIEIIRKRIDASGTKEPIILPQGGNRIIVQLPGVDDPSEIKKMIGRTAMLTFHELDSTMRQFYIKPDDPVPNFPKKPGVKYMRGEFIYKNKGKKERLISYYPIKTAVKMTGKTIVNAMPSNDEEGKYCVAISFSVPVGSQRFAKITKDLLGKNLAIVLDDEVLSAPAIRQVISGGRATITGNFSFKEASELSTLLRAGSLPAKLNVVEERTIGPSLGEESIQKGKTSVLVSFILVSVFMILSYGVFGVFATISLLFNIILLFAAFVSIGATLTLPGIAGIALTIGMAVDANVLLYERMREEIRKYSKKTRTRSSKDEYVDDDCQIGVSAASVMASVGKGFQGATVTVLDSNITTLVGAAVLYYFGSGPVRGFAVTLMIGTVISLFTTFFVTKCLIASYVRRKQNREFVI